MSIQFTKNKFRYALAGGVLILYLIFLFGLGYVFSPVYNWKLLLLGTLGAGLTSFTLLFELTVPEWTNTAWGALCLFASSPLSVWMIERMQAGTLTFSSPYFWLSTFCCSGLTFIFLLLTNRLRISVILSVTVFFFLGLINHYVIRFRDNPLQPWDILAAGTAADVMGQFEFTVTRDIAGAAAVMLSFFGAAVPIKNPPFLKKRRYTALPAACLAAVCLSLFSTQVLARRSEFTMVVWDTVGTSRANGWLINATLHLEIMQNNAPEGYSREAVTKAVYGENYETYLNDQSGRDDTSISASASIDESAERKPNVIAIMNESFSDLSILGEIGGEEDYMPFLRSLTENTVRGNLIVPTLGGGTCNTEYEFLTGNTCFMLREGSYPMQQFVNSDSPSLASTLKARGYQTVAIHPSTPNNWNRSRAYPRLGFDTFVSVYDFEDPALLRNLVSDRDSYQKVIEQYEQKGEEPIFIFNVTMQNHGGYTVTDPNFAETYTFPNDTQYPQGKQYLSLIRESDDAFRELVEYFSAQEEDTVILFFGDHQPAMGDGFPEYLLANGTLTEMQAGAARYVTPFYIWANYPIVEAEIEITSVNYLSTLLLETAEIEGTAYNDYLSELREILPVISPIFGLDTEGNVFNCRDKSIAHADLLNEYHMLQYNNVLDVGGRVDAIFYPEE